MRGMGHNVKHEGVGGIYGLSVGNIADRMGVDQGQPAPDACAVGVHCFARRRLLAHALSGGCARAGSPLAGARRGAVRFCDAVRVLRHVAGAVSPRGAGDPDGASAREVPSPVGVERMLGHRLPLVLRSTGKDVRRWPHHRDTGLQDRVRPVRVDAASSGSAHLHVFPVDGIGVLV